MKHMRQNRVWCSQITKEIAEIASFFEISMVREIIYYFLQARYG